MTRFFFLLKWMHSDYQSLCSAVLLLAEWPSVTVLHSVLPISVHQSLCSALLLPADWLSVTVLCSALTSIVIISHCAPHCSSWQSDHQLLCSALFFLAEWLSVLWVTHTDYPVVLSIRHLPTICTGIARQYWNPEKRKRLPKCQGLVKWAETRVTLKKSSTELILMVSNMF